MPKAKFKDTQKYIRIIQYSIFILFWGAFIAACLINRDKITVESIVTYTPDEPLWAVLVMLLLYALKSISFFIYGGILNMACGIMFSLPLALAVNTIGTAIMAIIPYALGKKMGAGALDKMTKQYPKLEKMKDFPANNGFFVSFFVRIVGILPGDLIGLYLGAAEVTWKEYFLGTMLGLLPPVYALTVMGASIQEPSSPQFVISLAFQIGTCVISLMAYAIHRKRNISHDNMEVTH